MIPYYFVFWDMQKGKHHISTGIHQLTVQDWACDTKWWTHIGETENRECQTYLLSDVIAHLPTVLSEEDSRAHIWVELADPDYWGTRIPITMVLD